ncbi:MAG: CRISPR-associated DxTHG motif protein [Deltaproteobacteria bacterium]|nr:CRISPR-associated DxTHG motif protein [Candidatus Zymogenaceae bacterium]
MFFRFHIDLTHGFNMRVRVSFRSTP